MHGLQEAGHPRRPHGRPVRQAALGRHRDARRRDAAELPRRHRQPPGFTPQEREPDPELLLRGYERAALTLNFVRALVDGGFADLHHPEYWDLGFVQHSPLKDAYQQHRRSRSPTRSISSRRSAARRCTKRHRVDFYTSHEGLHLQYEQAQTRYIERQQRWYNLSTHMPWIGMRTAQLDGAHVEYFRGIANPIGVKVGPAMTRRVAAGPDRDAESATTSRAG